MKMKLNRKVALAAGTLLTAALAAMFVLKARTSQNTEEPARPAATALTVAIVAPRSETWPQTFQASGQIAAWQEVIISPEAGGLRIAELPVDVGAVVRKGQLLAQLADDTLRADLRKQQALVAQAEANLAKASADLRRAEQVDIPGAIAPQKLDEYRATDASARASLASARADSDSTQLRLAQARIVAPDAGVISSRTAVQGNVANAGSELFRLVRQGRAEWRAELNAQQLPKVRPGQTARVTLPGGQQVQGTVRLASPTLNASTGRGVVYVSMPPGSPARPGIFASGNFELDSVPAQTLPQSAAVLRDGRAYVWVVDATNKVASRPVITGRRQGDRVEIVTPLPPGARVVARGGAFLAEGTQVTVESGASGEAKP